MKNTYDKILEDLEKIVKRDRHGIPINLAEIYDEELDQYDEIEDWMPESLVERLNEYWDSRDAAIDYQVYKILSEEND